MKSLNLLCVINVPSEFGLHSYPVKLYEAMRMKIPVVAIETPATKWILAGHEDILCPPNQPEELARTIKHASAQNEMDYKNNSSWRDSVKILEDLLNKTYF